MTHYLGAPRQLVGAPTQLVGANVYGHQVHGRRMYVGANGAGAPPDFIQQPATPMMGAIPSGPVVVDPGYRAMRRYPIGFGPLLVGAGTTLSITAQPQELFRPSRLVVPSTIAASFLINDLKIGMDSMLLSSNPVPAVMFIETAVDTWLGLSTATIGQLITLTVTNFTANSANFLAGLAGASAI
jgi:hypothetical protein